jgi:Glycolipid transfer protein (GLTP)
MKSSQNHSKLLIILLTTLAMSIVSARTLWSSMRGGAIVATRHFPEPTLYAELSIVEVNFGRGRKKDGPPAIPTKLGGILQSFRQVHSRRGSEDIHVGKLLAAFKRMQVVMQETGMRQVANTLSGNIAKLEDLYYRAPSHLRDSLSALLEYEIELGVHTTDKYGRLVLEDKSGATGIVWLARNLCYQKTMYQLMLDEEKEPTEAAQLAFQRHLRPHLHWTVANVLQAAMRSLTPSHQSTFFSRIGGFEEQTYTSEQDIATKRDVQDMVEIWEPLLMQLEKMLLQLELEAP